MPVNNKKLSIRLLLNGQSFSFNGANDIPVPYSSNVEIEVDSPKAVIAPCSNGFTAEECLVADGQKIDARKTVLTIEKGSFRVFITLCNEVQMAIAEKFTGKVTYTSSLLKAVEAVMSRNEESNVNAVLYFAGTDMNVAISNNKGLIYAETLPITGTDTLAYYLGLLNADFGLAGASITVNGESADKRCKFIKRYYPHTRCA